MSSDNTTAQVLAAAEGQAMSGDLDVLETGAVTVTQVTSRAELMQALGAATGNTIIELAAGEYGYLGMSTQFADTVTLRSADPGDPAVFTGLRLDNAANVAFEDVIFDYTAPPGEELWNAPFSVHGGHDIAFRNVVFDGDDARELDASSDGYPTGVGLYITSGARDVTLADSVVTGFWKGIRVVRAEDVTITGTEITDIRADGLNLVQVRNILVEDNHFHDFRLAPDSGDHRDMIQAWTRRTDEASDGIIIRGNLFDIGEGGPTQTIYFDSTAERPDLVFRNVVIEENVIVNAHVTGIVIGMTHGLTVTHNTLIQGEIAGEGVSNDAVRKPRISVDSNSTDVVLSHNVAHQIKGYEDQPDWSLDGNFWIQREAPGGAGYYADNFVAALDDATNAPANIQVLPGSPLDLSGAGAARLAYDDTPDTLTALVRTSSADSLNRMIFDAGLSAGPDGAAAANGATFLWDFGDGTTGTGALAEHVYAEPGTYAATLTVTMPDGSSDTFTAQVGIAGPELLYFDSETGALMTRNNGETTTLAGVRTVQSDDGTHAIVLDGNDITLPFSAVDGLYGSDNFQIEMSLRMPDGTSGAGEVFLLPKSLSVRVDGNGEIAVLMQAAGTSGWQWVTTQGARIQDGKWHDVKLDWDGDTLRIDVDGSELAASPLTGELKGAERWPPLFGSRWETDFKGELRDFSVAVDSDRWETAALMPEDAPEMPTQFARAFIFEQDTIIETGTDGNTAAGSPLDTALAADSFVFDLAAPPAGRPGHSLENGGFLDLGRLHEFEQSQNLTVDVDFYRTETGATDRAVIVGNHKNIWVEVVDERLRISLGTKDDGMHREYVGKFGLNETTDLQNLVLHVDADNDVASALLNGELIWELTGVDLQLAGGREWGWNIGARWGDSTGELAVTRLAITDNDPAPDQTDHMWI